MSDRATRSRQGRATARRAAPAPFARTRPAAARRRPTVPSLRRKASRKPTVRLLSLAGLLPSGLMPEYNESRTLRTIAGRGLASPVGLPIELVCVDDGSRDGSPEILDALAAEDPRIRVFRQPKNMGKGAAIRRAIEEM